MELHDDDKPIGRVLSRREVIKLLGGAGAILLGGAGWTRLVFAQDATATPEATTAVASCVVKPAETEGPYFVDEMLKRFDVRVDPTDGSIKDGIPLHLKFQVMQIDADACTPLKGAQVDIWHCDALGTYSDTSDPGFDTVGQKWLRGYQVTDDMGVVDFLTIYPGWYSGRTVHIHFKIRTDPTSETGYEFTSQLFFDDALSASLFTQAPYSTNPKGTTPDTPNASDSIYDDQLLLTVTQTSAADLTTAFASMGGITAEATAEATAEPTAQPVTRDGYTAVFDIALDLSAPQTTVGPNNGGGGPGGAPPNGTPPAGGPGGAPPGEATPEATASS